MNRSRLLLISILWTITFMAVGSDTMDLSGTWQFSTDANDRGENEQWYQTSLPCADTVKLPGSLQEQGYGNEPGPDTPWVGDIRQDEWQKPKYDPYRAYDNFKMPFWLQPDKYYKGAAWYQKTIKIPDAWKNKHITLRLERPHWQTSVWVDSAAVGSSNRLSVPHIYDLSNLLAPGEHVLTIRVDNRMIINIGPNSHSISDHTQSNWNGIVGKIELNAVDTISIEDVQVYPDLVRKCIKVATSVACHKDNIRTGYFFYEVVFDGQTIATHKTARVEIPAVGTVHECVIPLEGTVHPWDEFNPNLYTLKTRFVTNSDTYEHITTFGIREIHLDRNRIMLNGRRLFLRGTLECCIFPKTGYPPTDVTSWKRIINICKQHGLNHIRFHSWCPPEAAFKAADVLGFYFQVECSSWANQGSSLGDGQLVDQWLYHEADAILKAYGNHPSFMLFAYGNEPTGPERGAVYLRKWISHYKQKDPRRRLVTGGSGWPLLEESDFHVTPDPRIQQWGQQLDSRINSRPSETMTDYCGFVKRFPTQPVIAHEIGQWCVYPNFDEIKKYTGVLKPKNFEIFHDFLENKNMLDQAHDFLMASGKLQTLCYKEDIESALRTPDFGGFQLLDLHDFPGQGTALVGVLDPFWDSKPYVSPADYKRFSGPIVPLARMSKRVFTASETLTAQVDVSQFGPKDLTDVKVRWSLLDVKGKDVKQGILQQDKLLAGDLYTVGNLNVALSDLPTPAKYKLQLLIEGTGAVNDWDIWVYPDGLDVQASMGIKITNNLDSSMKAYMQQGGKVLLTMNPRRVKTDVMLGFSSIFWNTAWTDRQAPHTLGILCDPEHPALAQFPTEYHSNWQWSEPIQHAAAMVLDDLPIQLRPIIQVVPDWFEPKRLGLVFEVKIGNGMLMVSSVDLRGNLQQRPVARQLKASLLRYMASDAFNPEVTVDIETIQALFRDSSAMEKVGAKVIRVDSYEQGHDGAKVIDGNPETLWHTRWSGQQPGYPHEIQISLEKTVRLKGLTCMPRQDGKRNGWIEAYAVYVTETPYQWGEPVAKGQFTKDSSVKVIQFDQTVEGEYLRFVALKRF